MTSWAPAVAYRLDSAWARGPHLTSGNDDGIIRFWSLNADAAIERICATLGGLTLQQWHLLCGQIRAVGGGARALPGDQAAVWSHA